MWRGGAHGQGQLCWQSERVGPPSRHRLHSPSLAAQPCDRASLLSPKQQKWDRDMFELTHGDHSIANLVEGIMNIGLWKNSLHFGGQMGFEALAISQV